MKNELNYASFESSKKLFEIGVTLETEFYWCKDENGWYFRAEETYYREVLESIPAPSFAEIWKELLRLADGNEINIVYWIQEIDDWDAMGADVALLVVETCSNIIKLIELLIWVKVTIKNLL